MMKESLLFLLLCNSLLEAYSAHFASKPRAAVTAKIGDNVTFPWNFTLEAGEELLLMRLQYSKTSSFATSDRLAYSNKNDLVIDEPFRDRVQVEPSGSLTLHDVGVKDRGYYRCHIELTRGKPLWSKVFLFVGAPPVIQHFRRSNVTLLEGDHVKIFCHVSGEPAPRVTWHRKDNQSTDKKTGDDIFEIKNATLSDSGNYRCEASNQMGFATRTLRIQVYERPKVTSFSNTAALDGTIYECQEVSFTCEAFGNKPPVRRFHLYHNNKLIHRGSKTGTFRIVEVRKKDEGRYSCVPENEHGLGFNKSMDLKVIPAPDNCKETSVIPTDEITNTGSTFTSHVTNHLGKSSGPSNHTRSIIAGHSGSQIPCPCSGAVLFNILIVCMYTIVSVLIIM